MAMAPRKLTQRQYLNVMTVAVAFMILIFVLIAYQTPAVLFFVFLGYAISGPILTLWQKRELMGKRSRRGNSSQDSENNDGSEQIQE